MFFFVKGFTVFATILRFVDLLKSDADFSCISENAPHNQYTFALWSDDPSCTLVITHGQLQCNPRQSLILDSMQDVYIFNSGHPLLVGLIFRIPIVSGIPDALNG